MKSLALLAVFVPLVASADPIPSPPPPPRPTAPPLPRVTSADEVAGTWNVRVTTRLTSCKVVAPAPQRSDEVWTVTKDGAGNITVQTGTAELAGVAAAMEHGMFKHQLRDKHMPDVALLELGQSIKDRLWGTFVRADAAGKNSRCATVFDIWGTRAP